MKHIYLYLLLSSFLCGCQSSISGLEHPTHLTEAQITAVFKPQQGNTTTRTYNMDDILLNNWVFQIEGEAVIHSQRLPDKLRSGVSMYLPLQVSNSCDIYVIGNIGEAEEILAAISNRDQLINLRNATATTNAVFVATLLNVKVTDSGVIEKAAERVRDIIFYRNYAEVAITVHCNKANTFIKDISLINVAKESFYIGTDVLEKQAIIDTCVQPHAFTNGQYIWQMPPNRQGNNNAITEIENRYSLTAPSEQCTFIRLEIGEENKTTAYAYVIYLGNGNVTNFDVEANYRYNYDIIIDNTDEIILSDNRITPIDGLIDLNRNNQYANCYVCRPGLSYCFNATIRGNGSKDYGITDYFNGKNDPILTSEIERVDILWESDPDGSPNSYDIIDGQPIIKDNIITFKTGNIEGNAVITISDKSNILWSWHIWVTRQNTERVTPHGYMTMNIGATQDISGNCHAAKVGMLYQWGRKDPFRALKDDGTHNNEIGDGTTHMDVLYEAGTNSDRANMTRALRYPGSIMVSEAYGWFSTSTLSSYLWGGNANNYNKTAFDPCPIGWKVPQSTTLLTYSITNSGILCTNDNNNYLPHFNPINYTKRGVKPAYIQYIDNSYLYWSISYTTKQIFAFPDETKELLHPGTARAVRCIRDN
ncbi:MAG: hypothetical protein ACRDDZ_07085 [Marinifilaceae bacterium]